MNVLLTASKVPNTIIILLRSQKQRKKPRTVQSLALEYVIHIKIKLSTNPFKEKKKKKKMNHTKIKNEPVSDTKHKN